MVFSCEFCEIFKNTFLTEHLRATVSVTESIGKKWPNRNTELPFAGT